MNLLFIQHPYWVLLVLRVALVCGGEDDEESLANISFSSDNNNSSSDNNNSVPILSRRASVTSSYSGNILRKISSTTPITPADDDHISSTIVKTSSNADSIGLAEIRSARIMVSTLKSNRTSDTTDFARNTVPIKEQTPTDPTVKKTELPRKIIRKPSPDLKNKIKGLERSRYGGGPPGPDASMLAYNAFTSPVEATTERLRIKKPFTTKSRPPSLSYLTSSSTIDSPLPPTAWALTTLKGSAPAVEHVKNTIPATASEPFKLSRTRTSPSSVKTITSFWSTRLASKSPPTATVSSYETSESTELPPIEEKKPAVLPRTTTSSTTESVDPKSDDSQLNKITEEKVTSTSELNAVDTVNNTIIISNSVSKNDGVKPEVEVIKEALESTAQKQAPTANEEEESQININKKEQQEDVVTEKKPESQKTTSNEIELQKEEILSQKNNNKTVMKIEPIEESINEAIKTGDEENKLSKKILDKNYIKKPINYENKNVAATTNKNLDNNTTTESNNVLTEKPASVEETLKEVTTDNVNKSAVSDNAVISKSLVTELDRIVADIEHENNYNTAVYPFGNVINETKFNHKYLVEDKQDLNRAMDLRIVSSNDTELNSIKSSSSVDSYHNRTQNNILKEIDQSTTSMTRATNATQAPVNSTTEANIVTVSPSIVLNITTEEQITTVAPPTITTLKDELLTTVIVDDNSDATEISEFTGSPSTISSIVPVIAERMDNTQLFNISADSLNITNENETEASTEIIKKLDDTHNKIINLNTTLNNNSIKSKNFTRTFPDTSMITTVASNLMKNYSIPAIVKHQFELNQTNNDIKIGGELDLPVPTIISVSLASSTRSNYLKTTTERIPTTTKYFEITDEATVTELYIDKEKMTTVSDEGLKQNETVSYPYDIYNETESTLSPAILHETDEMKSTLSPAILHATDEVNEDDSLVMYNTTTGNETKFAIDSKINMTEHDLDEDGDDAISAEKDLPDLMVPANNTSLINDYTTVISSSDIMKTTTEVVPRTNTGPSVSNITTTTPVTIIPTTPSLDEDVVTPGDDDSTGIDMDDYDTGVIMPMNVRMYVHATYKDMCSSKDLLIDSIVRFFHTIADRSIDRNQIKIKNLIHECNTPHPEDKGVVPVHLLITDSHGQYDKRLTDVFVLLVRQESLSFKYPITQVDKIIDPGMSMESETQGRGTLIAAIVISSIAGLCLLVLTILLVIMRKRQRGFNYGQRCTPVSLDDYSLDNISVCNSVRRKALRASKRSYGNPAFDDPTAISNSLNFAGLAVAVNEKNKLEDEYSRIPVVTVKPDELPPGAEVKNRYANVIPLPETRVTLKTPNNNDFEQFINANFVKGTKSIEKFYIACQAPIKDTITDFWQMVWEQQSRIIIMLTDLHENGVEKCADYLPPSEVLDCHRVFGDLQVTLKKREAREKYIISSLQLKNLESNLWREVTHMWYVGWPVRGVPDDLSSVIAFLIEARSYAKNGPPPPIVVHCSPGTGRTGTIIAIDIAIRDFETNRVVDIPRTVYNVRRDRAGAVQTSQQYTFIYQVLHLYATKLTGGGLDSI